MGHRARALALAAMLATPLGGALADPAYKASDILARFAPDEAASATRRVCVGTASECAASEPAKPKPADNFDLRVNFNYNSETLTGPARSNLDEFAKALKDPRLANSQFLVEGHTDGAGSDAFNLDLSRRRAQSVVKYLASRGVGPARLEAKGYGKQHLIVPDPMASANRRVETRLRTP